MADPAKLDNPRAKMSAVEVTSLEQARQCREDMKLAKRLQDKLSLDRRAKKLTEQAMAIGR